jgi:adenylosuccinate synthase
MDVPDALSAMPLERQVLIHGTHSPRYSLFSGSTYPAATSAECSVAGVLGRLGVSPRRLKDVVGVVDLVPNTTSEHLALPNELHPQEIERRGWRSHGIVSGLPRRFGLGIDYLNLDDFVRKERPSELALGRADLYDIENSHVRSWCQLGNSVRSLVDELEERYGVPVRAVSTGRLVEDIAFDTGSRGKVLS